jgi:NAD(P)-dependent dehydrogenase (short-subunit alcohol dehydrogenase family)
VVVTGASAGVGRAVVRELAAQGASVGLIARGLDGLEGARRDVEAAGAKALVVQADVADAAQVEQAADRIERELGPIDVWVNNAMVTVMSPIVEMTPDDYRRVTEVTYLGSVWGTLAALRRMRPRNRGVIIQIGSALAHRSIPLQSAYCAAKHAVHGFIESLRCELIHAESAVRVTEVEMPALNTPQFEWSKTRMGKRSQPVPPIFQPEVAARAVWFAATHERRALWVGWPTVKAIVGNRIAPWLLDRWLAHGGWEGQLTAEPLPPGRGERHNLYAPFPGDHGAHGRFDGRARRKSLQAWIGRHRAIVGALACVVAALVLVGVGLELATG